MDIYGHWHQSTSGAEHMAAANSDDSSSNSSGTNGSMNLGKRQRFMNLVKNTKNVYLPSLTSSLSQKTEGFRLSEEYQQIGNLSVDCHIAFYPTYTKESGGGYETTIRFSLCAPGNPQSRRNRFFLSLCRQYLLPRNVSDVDQEILDTKLNDALAVSDTKSLVSSSTNDNMSTATNGSRSNRGTSDPENLPNNGVKCEYDTLKNRISGFLERKIANVEMIVDAFTEEAQGSYETTFINTDNIGYVETRMNTSFKPKHIRITADTPHDFPKIITHEFPTNFIKPDGYGLISDVDDTIKHTGVTGDKRSMFRNVFVQDFNSWEIEGVSKWYKTLKERKDVDFFYVSNSPMQIYSTLHQYITTNFPWGPIFLKRYSGNLLSSIWSSSADKKLGTICQILQDFPKKKFFLVGDSGEQDFEAYITAFLRFPDQIMGIYIRCCKDSLSDMGLRESEVMHLLNDMIEKEYMGRVKKRPLPPPIPKKKPQLTFEQEKSVLQSRPPRSHMRPRPVPPMLPPMLEQPPVFAANETLGLQGGYRLYDNFFDKRADQWRHRVYTGLQQLKRIRGEGQIRLMFFTDTNLPLKSSMQVLSTKVN